MFPWRQMDFIPICLVSKRGPIWIRGNQTGNSKKRVYIFFFLYLTSVKQVPNCRCIIQKAHKDSGKHSLRTYLWTTQPTNLTAVFLKAVTERSPGSPVPSVRLTEKPGPQKDGEPLCSQAGVREDHHLSGALELLPWLVWLRDPPLLENAESIFFLICCI